MTETFLSREAYDRLREEYDELTQPKRRPFIPVLILVGLVAISGAVVLTFLDPESKPQAAEGGTPTPPSPSPAVEEPRPLGRPALEGLADSVAESLFRGGDQEVAEFKITHARLLTGCVVTAFLGGPSGTEHEDIAEPKTREWIRSDAKDRGWDVAFAHVGRQWIVLAQACDV